MCLLSVVRSYVRGIHTPIGVPHTRTLRLTRSTNGTPICAEESYNKAGDEYARD